GSDYAQAAAELFGLAPTGWRAVRMGRSAEMSGVPRFVVVALVFVRDGESILLVKQSYGGRYWSLPGGKMEHRESIDQAAIREAREETGLEVRIKRVVGLYSKVGER